MTPKYLLLNSIDPALALLGELTAIKPDPKARLLVLAIAGQESAWAARRQIGGPARSFWQFEKGGGVAGLFQVTPRLLETLCAELLIPFNPNDVFEAMAWNDMLAAGMARLLLWSDPKPLPEVGDVQGSWDYYQRNWRPGVPHPEVWAGRYGTSMGLVGDKTT